MNTVSVEDDARLDEASQKQSNLSLIRYYTAVFIVMKDFGGNATLNAIYWGHITSAI